MGFPWYYGEASTCLAAKEGQLGAKTKSTISMEFAKIEWKTLIASTKIQSMRLFVLKGLVD